MHTIGTLIYGIPIDEDLAREYQEYELNEEDPMSIEDMFTTLYHGSSTHEVGYLGIKIKEFFAIQEPMLLSDLISKASVTNEKKEEVKRKFDSLPSELKGACMPIGFYIIWSTS